MRTETGKAVHLKEYRVPDYLVERVDLDFQLHPHETKVVARLLVAPNPKGIKNAPLKFDGDGLNVIGVSIDGGALDGAAASMEPDGLTIFAPPQKPFTLETVTLVDPTNNTQLSGLYRSSGVYCTQCEAEGFRRITYFPDRPDVLSVYTTRITAPRAEAPILLGNGNPLDIGDAGDGRHFAIWHDPHPKPCYLFALVGGDLDVVHDDYATSSGRPVKLGIYVERGKGERAGYAMDALIRSMRWDETVFGREYDLDVFNIVAVSDFNMGAMENKGLNIFNDKYVLATPDTATDADYANIEAIIAHEYFHNWTGNRITCRDWFQLCLKEGLTVYRDQEFSADERSRPVKRISDVRGLRAAQFPEDAGPLAHNVRPETYHEINNFYTATVYQKGAEVIRTLKAFIGSGAFRSGMDLYFERFDGTAATIEDFISCFADASGRDLSQFMLWYSQAGTPLVKANAHYDASRKTLTLDLSQSIPATPGQDNKQPHVLPVKLGLVSHNGGDLPIVTPAEGKPGGSSPEEIAAATFILSSTSRRIEFHNVPQRPALSLFRGLSAPVRLEIEVPDEDYLALAAHDSDMFNRWQAIQTCATKWLVSAVAALRGGKAEPSAEGLLHALANVLANWERDPEFTAQALSLPLDADIAREIGSDVDPDAIFSAGRRLRHLAGVRLKSDLERIYAAVSAPRAYTPDARSAGYRSLRAIALRLLADADAAAGSALALQQYRCADNMTDRMSALGVLCAFPSQERGIALAEFEQTYASDPLIMDKWFSLQAAIPETGTLQRARALMQHPAFSMTNPNRLRSVVATFAMANQTQFNAPDGSGYDFVAGVVEEIDARNPQIAARLLVAFRSWRTLEPVRSAAAERALKRVAARENLSADVRDIVTRSLA